eukprot:scaffold188388_cov19-Prasinocladus_malaysianus.AAC.1
MLHAVRHFASSMCVHRLLLERGNHSCRCRTTQSLPAHMAKATEIRLLRGQPADISTIRVLHIDSASYRPDQANIK